MALKGKLNRLKKNIIKDESNHSPVEQPIEDTSTNIPFLEKWKSIGAEPFFFDNSYCFVRKVVYPLDYQHGIYSFRELNEIVGAWNQTPIDHPLSSKGLASSDLFFFDTETTGLGGGAGNTIFLLGHARLEDHQIVVTQHFLPTPGSEIALYQSFLSSVDYTTLVTYNGKSFDWPQVKTRHTLIRDSIPKLPEFGHFDLYHAARRLWKNKLESVRLANVEKDILSVKRQGDVPGYLAPMLYFDFIESQNPEGIMGVLHHNEIDVLSLITLYIHLSKKLVEAARKEHADEQYEVARWFKSLGETKTAEDVYQNVVKNNNRDQIKAKMELAFLYKQQKNYKQALQQFKEVYGGGNSPELFVACIEIAKIYEHRIKDYQLALFFAKEASVITKSHHDGNDLNLQVVKRVERLQKKVQKYNGIFPGQAQK